MSRVSRYDSDLSSVVSGVDGGDSAPTQSPHQSVPYQSIPYRGGGSYRHNATVRGTSWMVTYHGADVGLVDETYINRNIERIRAEGINTRVQYATWQLEMAPTTGQHHIQMYVEFDQYVRQSFVTRLFNDHSKVYSELRKGTREACQKYCTKPETRIAGPFEIGVVPQQGGQGRRNDVHTIHEMIDAGAKQDEIYSAFPNTYMRMTHGVKNAMAIVRKRDAPVDRPVKVIVLFGKTGTGKTFGVVNQGGVYVVDASMLQANTSNLWWDGYEGEERVLFDEYNDWFGIAPLLKYLDKYAVRIQNKGSSTVGYWSTLYITSNKAPWEWKDRNGQEFTPEHKAALHRRIHTIGEVKCYDKGKTREITLSKLNGRLVNKKQIEEWIGEENVEHYESITA